MRPVPVSIGEPVNQRILAVSEDQLQGFWRDPFVAIAERSGVPVADVRARLAAMLRAGVIRRVRQTLLSTNLAPGALCAWKVPGERLHDAFDDLFNNDPFSGHVVIRSTDAETAGSQYRLWTTLKVPQGYALEKHAAYVAERIGARGYRLMPARMLFTLGVGHTRRRGMEPGSRADTPAEPVTTCVTPLSELQWRVLTALKREFQPDEIREEPWASRAAEAGVSLDTFLGVSRELAAMRLIGRFSTFLEHVKELPGGERVTRYNALFHWAVPPGQELAAGQEVGRHDIITHAYWREGGPEFAHVNVMAVAHGMEKDVVTAHKAAIDAHLAEAGIEAGYTNVFWGGRSEIKPSEVSPLAYARWCRSQSIDPDSMREEA